MEVSPCLNKCLLVLQSKVLDNSQLHMMHPFYELCMPFIKKIIMFHMHEWHGFVNSPTNNKGPSSSIIWRITNHCLLSNLLENHIDVLLWVAPHNGCTNGFYNLLENRYNLRNLVDHGTRSNICNLFMLHIASYKLVAFSWLCAHGKTRTKRWSAWIEANMW